VLQRLKRTVARVDIDGEPNGTAFLVDAERVVTALHVLRRRRHVTLKFLEWSGGREHPPGAVAGRSAGSAGHSDDGVRSATLIWLPDHGADLAMLELDRPCPPFVSALEMGSLPPPNSDWYSFGFPREATSGHTLADGIVRDPAALYESLDYRVLQLETPSAREWLSWSKPCPAMFAPTLQRFLTRSLREHPRCRRCMRCRSSC
jgi:hypothetical protein